MLEANEELLI